MVDFTGGTWRSLIDGSEVSAIADSVVCRTADDDSSQTSSPRGLEFEVKSDFLEVGYRISENTTENDGTARLYEDDDGSWVEVETKDITGLGSNDEFSIPFDYNSNLKYVIEIDLDGDSFGFTSTQNFPYEDDNIKITDATRDGGDSADLSAAISCIGDLGIQ